MKKLLLFAILLFPFIGCAYQTEILESCHQGDRVPVKGEPCIVLSVTENPAKEGGVVRRVVCQRTKSVFPTLVAKNWIYTSKATAGERIGDIEMSFDLKPAYVLTPLAKMIVIGATCFGGHYLASKQFGSDYLSKMSKYIFDKKDELAQAIQPVKDAAVETIKPLYENVSSTLKPIAAKIGALIKPAITKSTEVVTEAVKTVTNSTTK